MYKNIFLASVIALVLIVSASSPVQALTAGDIQSQIQQLLSKISELTRQIEVLRSQNGNGATVTPPASALSHRICTIAMRQFNQGASGDDVKAFQEFLRSEGYFDRVPTGYFGTVTKDSLARWQASQGFEGAGVIGPKTLERIKIKCGIGNSSGRLSANPSSGTAPLSVTFSHYVGGFRPAGISYVLDFGDGSSERATECSAPADACTGPGKNTHTYQSNGTYTATLTRVTDPCPDDGDPSTPRCLAAVQSEVIGKTQVFVGTTGACTKEYMPVCGAKPVVCITTPCNPVPTNYGNKCTMNADGASFLYEGQCRSGGTDPAADRSCKAWHDGCNSCARETADSPAMCTLKYCAIPAAAYCTAWFDANSNKAPVISGLSGPTSLTVNQTGTWTVIASDPENQNLSYAITWGDDLSYATPSVASAAYLDRQTTTFTHAYSKAGTYTVTVVVRDANGKEAKTTTTVRVDGAVNCPMTQILCTSGTHPYQPSGTDARGCPLQPQCVADTTACTAIYQPVCGRPAGCANTCAPGMYCTAVCQLHTPQTYGNKCSLTAANATFLHEGQCTSSSGNWY
ncbi:MAG: PKD domain-containing protein [Minisyncoccia bacterium]